MDQIKELIAGTPKPPYYAVIFTSLLNKSEEGYEEMSNYLVEAVQHVEGFLGFETARENLGITVSYWKDLSSIKKWKFDEAHKNAQEEGKKRWYTHYKIRIACVEHDYEFNR